MSAVAESDVEQFVARPEVGRMYMAYRENLILVKTPIYPVRGPDGRQVGETHGQTVVFNSGVLRLPAEGPTVLKDGREIDTDELIAWLDSHRLNGSTYEGFWSVDPVAPAPNEHEMQSIADASIALDADKLEAIIEQEASGYGREAVLGTARTSLERVRAARVELEQQQAEAIAKAEARGREEALKEQRAKAAAKAENKPAQGAE